MIGGGLLDRPGEQTNQSQLAATYLNGIGSSFSDLFFHALSTMHTPAYRTANAGALLADWPRIPLPASAGVLANSAMLGRQLADLLDPESSIDLRAEWSFLAALKLPPNLDLEEALKINGDWGRRGQGSTVMPGPGKAPTREWDASERQKLVALAVACSVHPDSVVDLLGEACLDVQINNECFWSAVPVKVWDYTLGGYQVLKKWLSYREFSLLGRPLRPEKAAYFSQVVRRIAAVILVGPSLDASYRTMLSQSLQPSVS